MTNPSPYARAIGAGFACLLVWGCASGPPSADVQFGGVSRPADEPLPADPPGSLDGLYTGTASETDDVFQCLSPLNISNFQVEQGRVRFGGFRGPIAPDGTVSIPFGGSWLFGRFQGSEFNGRVDTTNSIQLAAGCSYAISARRVGG